MCAYHTSHLFILFNILGSFYHMLMVLIWQIMSTCFSLVQLFLCMRTYDVCMYVCVPRVKRDHYTIPLRTGHSKTMNMRTLLRIFFAFFVRCTLYTVCCKRHRIHTTTKKGVHKFLAELLSSTYLKIICNWKTHTFLSFHYCYYPTFYSNAVAIRFDVRNAVGYCCPVFVPFCFEIGRYKYAFVCLI